MGVLPLGGDDGSELRHVVVAVVDLVERPVDATVEALLDVAKAVDPRFELALLLRN